MKNFAVLFAMFTSVLLACEQQQPFSALIRISAPLNGVSVNAKDESGGIIDECDTPCSIETEAGTYSVSGYRLNSYFISQHTEVDEGEEVDVVLDGGLSAFGTFKLYDAPCDYSQKEPLARMDGTFIWEEVRTVVNPSLRILTLRTIYTHDAEVIGNEYSETIDEETCSGTIREIDDAVAEVYMECTNWTSTPFVYFCLEE